MVRAKSSATEAKERVLMERDQRIAKMCRHEGKEGKRASMHRETFFNAVDIEGPDVVTEAGEGYWKDMYRKYPWLTVGGMGVDDGQNAAGTRNRFGRVSKRKRRGRWEAFDAVRRVWVECEAPPSRLVL